jgi:hypothetical protein
MGFQNSNLYDFFRFYKKHKENDLSNFKKVELIVEVSFETFGQVQYKDESGRNWVVEFTGTKWEKALFVMDEQCLSFSVFIHNQKLLKDQSITLKLMVEDKILNYKIFQLIGDNVFEGWFKLV